MDFHSSLSKVMDLLLDAVCVVDARGCFVFVSAGCEPIFGYTQQEMLGRNMIDLVFPEDRARTLAAAEMVMQGQEQRHFENRYVRKDGRVVDIMWSARWFGDEGLRLAVARDVTELKRAERMRSALYEISEAAHVAEGLASVLRHVHRIIADLLPADNFQVVLYDEADHSLSCPYCVEEGRERAPVSLAPESLAGQVIASGKPVRTNWHGGGVADEADWLGVPLITTRGRVMGALVVQSHNGHVQYTGQDSELLQFVSTQVASAIERRMNEDRLQHMAHHDALTGLPNRALFDDRLHTAIKRARRGNERLALLYMDLDDFKRINDTLGHRVGDLVLCEMARRLRCCVRDSDTLGRCGGDEFTALLVNVDPDHTDQVDRKIRAALSLPFEVEGHTFRLSMSIGKAVYPEHGESPEQLFRYADAGMYATKRAAARYG